MTHYDAEEKLPSEILQLAIHSGQEYGWRTEDVLATIEAARDAGLATLGGQVQFVFPDATAELYWLHYDPEERQFGEPWRNYVARSAMACQAGIWHILSHDDIVEEGKRIFPLLQLKEAEGVDLAAHLVFLVYFVDEAEWSFLQCARREIP